MLRNRLLLLRWRQIQRFRLPIAHQSLQLGIGNIDTLQASRHGRIGRLKQHVAAAEQPLRARLVENDPAVNRGGDGKSNAGREVGFNQAGYHIDGWALGSNYQVNARRPSQLSQPRQHPFSLIGRHHHQVGQLINDKDQIGQFLLAFFLHLLVVVSNVTNAKFRETSVSLIHLA